MSMLAVTPLRRLGDDIDGAHSPSAPMDTLDPAQQDQAHLFDPLRNYMLTKTKLYETCCSCRDIMTTISSRCCVTTCCSILYRCCTNVVAGIFTVLCYDLLLHLIQVSPQGCVTTCCSILYRCCTNVVAGIFTVMCYHLLQVSSRCCVTTCCSILYRCCTNVVAGIFTVMCYNVLCDKYATRQMYGYCPSWALTWEYRKKGILDEIRHYSADIISLQEVETSQFYNFFLPELKRDGYDGIFSPKSRAKTMAENERKYVDGCAIFYRTAKFSLIKEHLVEFNQLAMANAEGSDHMLNRVMPKDNIGLAALLKTKEAAWDNGLPPDVSQVHQPLLVCTAHIHWDPEFCDVKLIQTMMLSNELRGILEDASQSFRPGHKPDTSGIQLLLCGDFNSLPDSGVIEFLTSGRVPADHKDFKALTYKSSLQKISGCDKANEFIHSFKLASAYSEDIMPFTNYTFDFKGIIDYIFYAKSSMTPLGLLGPVAPEWLKENKIIGCPHPHVPSAFEFKSFIPIKNKKQQANAVIFLEEHTLTLHRECLTKKNGYKASKSNVKDCRQKNLHILNILEDYIFLVRHRLKLQLDWALEPIAEQFFTVAK
uniref:poly(A)-specific ribonuclease n=1 Tax=Timema genevievae TaxID=629358 RepID=A0A7R9PKN5_TIMGE|nr:unnamed protein product [Timema genevievae]